MISPGRHFNRLVSFGVTLSANSATTLPAGASLTLASAGSVSFAPGGTGGTIPITLGDGILLRVSGDSSASITRSNVTAFAVPEMTIGAGARLSGEALLHLGMKIFHDLHHPGPRKAK